MRHEQLILHKNQTSMKMLVILLLFIGAQILGIFHLVEHSIEGDNDGCEICAAVAHSGTAALPEPVHIALPQELVQQTTDAPLSHFFTSRPTVYVSRAPPSLS